MTRYVLDTDTLSLLERGHPTVQASVDALNPDRPFITPINIEEQLSGWYSLLRQAKKDSEFVRAMIRYEIDRALFGVSEARRHLIDVDPQAKVAMTAFGEAAKLSDLSRLASKAAH